MGLPFWFRTQRSKGGVKPTIPVISGVFTEPWSETYPEPPDMESVWTEPWSGA